MQNVFTGILVVDVILMVVVCSLAFWVGREARLLREAASKARGKAQEITTVIAADGGHVWVADSDMRAIWGALGPDERAVMTRIGRRLVVGRARYGMLDLALDERRMDREALDEALDLAVYLACGEEKDARTVSTWDRAELPSVGVKVGEAHNPESCKARRYGEPCDLCGPATLRRPIPSAS